MLLRYAWRELRNSPRFCLLFIINLALGLVGFIGLDTLKRSFSDRLASSARSMLTADMSLSSRSPFNPVEMEAVERALPTGTLGQDMITLYSMVSSAQRSTLVELKGIEQGYPFYGHLVLKNFGTYDSSQKLPLDQQIWVVPELLIQLDTQIGATLRIGSKDFIIADTLLDDSSASMVGTSMAPRIYMQMDALRKADLIKFGSTAWRTKLFKLAPGTDLAAAKTKLSSALKEPGTRLKTYLEAGQDDGRMLNYLSDYLGLVSLVALALAAIGASYLFRVYLDRKQNSIATLISLGLTHERAILLYLLQVALLGLVSAIASSLLSMLLLPLGVHLLKSLTPVPLNVSFSWPSYGLALLLGTIGAALVCLPLLARIKTLNPSTLFQEHSDHNELFQKTAWLAYLPSLLAFYGLAVWQAHSFRVGSIFVGILAVIIIIFVVMALLLLKITAHFKRGRSLSTRLALSYLNSHRSHTISCFVALGVGATLINLIPQVQHSIQSELERPEGDRLPSLFLFDIQDEQIEPLVEQLREQQVEPSSVSPMIMGRLTAINGQAYQRSEDQANFTREGEQEQNFRNRGVNVSYRDKLAQGESIVAGKFFSKPYQLGQKEAAELSIEERYAERMGLKLGDILTFDIQGLPIEGRISSLRSVKWNTFQPNFFILMQPGVIDDAPKTYLTALPDLETQKKALLQKDIVDQFPNISIIDVSKLVAKLSELVQQMALVLVVMGWLTVLTGNVVVFSIAHQQALFRRWDHNLLKVLGAELALIMQATLKEFGILACGAAVLGSLLGLGASLVIAKGIFRGLWQPSLLLPCYLALLLVGVCLLTSYIATKRILAQRPSLQLDEP